MARTICIRLQEQCMTTRPI